MANLSGASLSGTSITRQRIENDYYATPIESTQALYREYRSKLDKLGVK